MCSLCARMHACELQQCRCSRTMASQCPGNADPFVLRVTVATLCVMLFGSHHFSILSTTTISASCQQPLAVDGLRPARAGTYQM